VIIKSWQSQYDQLKLQHEKEVEEHEKSRSSLAETKQALDKLQQSYNEVEAKLQSNELLVQMTRNSKSSSSAISRLTHLEEESKDLHMKLSLADKEIVSLKIQLEETKGHAKQYKTISETMEKTIKESSESNEKTKQVLEANIASLNEELSQLKTTYSQLLETKNQLDVTIDHDKEFYQSKIDTLDEQKTKLESDLNMLTKRFENTEKILEERTRNRDDYVAKIAVLEEQLKSGAEKCDAMEANVAQLATQLHEKEQMLTLNTNELEKEKRANLNLGENYENTSKLVQENLDKLQSENQALINHNNLLEKELSRMSQDLVVLKSKDSFKSSSADDKMTSETAEQQASSTELLDITRYLRTQKDQLEENYDKLKLQFDVNQQRLKTLENETDYYRKQSEQYETEITLLKSSNVSRPAADQSNLSQDNLTLIMDTNKRLKEDCDGLNTELTKLNNEIRVYEEEISNLKANFTTCELQKESLAGENECMKVEVKRWKGILSILIAEKRLLKNI
jgi:chromosome segregation ATPase